jgi:hypothetical protein
MSRPLSRSFALSTALLALAPLVWAQATQDKSAQGKTDHDPYDQSKVPLEVDSPDPKLAKIVLLAGSRSHNAGEHEFFAGTAILMKCLKQNPGVWPVMARDGWPKNEGIFKDAKSVVFYMDGRGGHPIIRPGRMDMIQKLVDQKAGFVNMHYAVDYDKEPGQRVLPWLGGFYDAEISINPTWEPELKALPDHPITRGVKPFKLRDEWYYNMRWVPDMKGVTPILVATPPDSTRRTADTRAHPGREEIMAWAFERPNGGRGFGFTGGHYNRNWGNDDYRRLVVNALLWSAGLEVPPGGAKCDIDPIDLNSNLDRKGGRRG